MQVVTQALNNGSRELLIGISSPGGSVFHGISAYNFLRGLKVTVTTHNYAQVDSIAAVIFSAGDQRLCVPEARFLMHSVATSFEQKATLEEDQLRERLDGLKKDTGTIATILSTRTGKNFNEIRELMLSRSLLGPDEAKELGLVHDIAVQVFDPNLQILNVHSQ